MGVDVILTAIGISEEQVDEAMVQAKEEADPHVRFYCNRHMFHAIEALLAIRPRPLVAEEIMGAIWMPEFQTPMEDNAILPSELARRVRACGKYWDGPEMSFERLSELMDLGDGTSTAPFILDSAASNFEELRMDIVNQFEALARHCDYVGRAGATAAVLWVSV